MSNAQNKLSFDYKYKGVLFTKKHKPKAISACACNPYRGAGLGFDKAVRNARKYKVLTFEHLNKITFKDLKKGSRFLYSWYIAELKCLRHFEGSAKTINIKDFISDCWYKRLSRNKAVIYKRLAELIN